MSDPPNPAPAPSFSLGRLLIVAVPVALATWGVLKLYGGSVAQEQQAAEASGQRKALVGLLGAAEESTQLAKNLADADGDLVADPPKDVAQQLDPEELNFSYVASGDAEDQQATWKELLAKIEESTGKKVNLIAYDDTFKQSQALKSGELHITGFSTGEAPGAVNDAGFVPVACFADQNGDYRITMKIIVPADSPIQKVEDLKNRQMYFVRPRSNSGCTAAVVMLMEKHDLKPERDYSWRFSYDHRDSIQGVADKKFEAAAVASDILEQMIAEGKITEDSIRTIYTSEPFPPGVVGVAYNLKPELQEKIKAALLGFDWAGSGLATKYNPSGYVKFAPVNYKDDWAAVREIRQTSGELLSQLGG
jgi:phosphonate transport system substrate-binding protein